MVDYVDHVNYMFAGAAGMFADGHCYSNIHIYSITLIMVRLHQVYYFKQYCQGVNPVLINNNSNLHYNILLPWYTYLHTLQRVL